MTTIPTETDEVRRIKENIQKDDLNNQIKAKGLYEDLDKEDYDNAIKVAREKLKEMNAFDETANLEKDLITIPGQKFCTVSWVGPTFKAKTELYGFRIMGAFDTFEKAQKHAQKVNKMDPAYDIGVMEMNLWCLGYPDNSDILLDELGNMDIKQMEKNRDRVLNEFIIRHKTELEETKQLFEARRISIRKSKITKEGNIEDAIIKEIPQGKPTEEMKKMHSKEISKWITPTKETEETEETKETEEIEETENLDYECKIKIPNQEYAVISYISSKGKNKRIPICIKGIFSNLQEAESHITKLIQMDDTYDMLPAPLYKWLLCDPDITQIRQIYKDKKLNDLLETDQNQREESLGFHQVKITGGNLDEPLDPNYKGKGTLFITEENEQIEDDDDITSAVSILKSKENDVISTYSFNASLISNKDIETPMFSQVDEDLKKLNEKIKQMMIDEGISEDEAKARNRIEMEDIKFKEPNPEDTTPIPKIKNKHVRIEDMISFIEDLKEKGHSNEEIRKIVSEHNSKKDES